MPFFSDQKEKSVTFQMSAKRFNKKSGTVFRREREKKAKQLGEILKKTPALQTLFTKTSQTSTDNRILGSTSEEKDDDVGIVPVFIEPECVGNPSSASVEKATAEPEAETESYGFDRNGN